MNPELQVPFRTKICGVTTTADAEILASAECDAIGLNFYRQSPRYVSPEQGREIGQGLSLVRVGVFVNSGESELREIAETADLDYVQLHGDEPPELIAELQGFQLIPGFQVIRAFRCKDEGLEPIISYLAECERLAALPSAILLDAYSPNAYGGTGEVIDWSSIKALRTEIAPKIAIVLAGGLTAGNVAEAIRAGVPDGVDTASGVESEPGIKDETQVNDFIKNAKNQYDLPG
jgi:phosphoribosylanthranilate isomerase